MPCATIRNSNVCTSVDKKGDYTVTDMQTQLPIYQKSIDWDAFFAEYPVPDVYERTVYKWPPARLREFQNKRFMRLMDIGWKNEFYRRRWSAAGIKPGDIKSIDDIAKLPAYTSD